MVVVQALDYALVQLRWKHLKHTGRGTLGRREDGNVLVNLGFLIAFIETSVSYDNIKHVDGAFDLFLESHNSDSITNRTGRGKKRYSIKWNEIRRKGNLSRAK